jgi:hypothetical protein
VVHPAVRASAAEVLSARLAELELDQVGVDRRPRWPSRSTLTWVVVAAGQIADRWE